MFDFAKDMNITVYTVSEEFAVSEAYTMFRTMGLRHLVVVNEMNRLKGMITKKDLLEHSCKEKYKELKRLLIKLFFNFSSPNLLLHKQIEENEH